MSDPTTDPIPVDPTPPEPIDPGPVEWWAVYDAQTGALLSTTTVKQLPDPLPEGTAAVAIDHQPSTGEVWDPQSHTVVRAQLASGLPPGALVYLIAPGDPLGMPLHVLRATDPVPKGATVVPVVSLPQAGYEWDGADFVQPAGPAMLAEQALHGLLLPLVTNAVALSAAHQHALDDAAMTAYAPGFEHLAAVAWRKVALALEGSMAAGGG